MTPQGKKGTTNWVELITTHYIHYKHLGGKGGEAQIRDISPAPVVFRHSYLYTRDSRTGKVLSTEG